MYSGSVCPRCSSRKIRRTKRKGFWERVILDSVGIRPYRCEECDERFLRYRGQNAATSGHDAAMASRH